MTSPHNQSQPGITIDTNSPEGAAMAAELAGVTTAHGRAAAQQSESAIIDQLRRDLSHAKAMTEVWMGRAQCGVLTAPVAWWAYCEKTGGEMVRSASLKDMLIEEADSIYAEHGYVLRPLYASVAQAARDEDQEYAKTMRGVAEMLRADTAAQAVWKPFHPRDWNLSRSCYPCVLIAPDGEISAPCDPWTLPPDNDWTHWLCAALPADYVERFHVEESPLPSADRGRE